jgi:hypothetical protein
MTWLPPRQYPRNICRGLLAKKVRMKPNIQGTEWDHSRGPFFDENFVGMPGMMLQIWIPDGLD